MKKLIYCILLATGLLTLDSCVMSSDKDYFQDPGCKLSTIFYNTYLMASFRAGEMTLFFDEYQELRQDIEASRALVKQYFGRVDSYLLYEEVKVDSHGTIYLTKTPHSYKFEPSYWQSGSYMNSTIAGDDISISVISSGMTCDISMSVIDNQLYVNDIDYVGEDGNDSRLTVMVLRPLSMPVCSNGCYSLYPEDGLLKFAVSGSVEDSFEVEFHNGSHSIKR